MVLTAVFTINQQEIFMLGQWKKERGTAKDAYMMLKTMKSLLENL